MSSPAGRGTGNSLHGVSRSALALWFQLWGVSESGLHPLQERLFAPRTGFGELSIGRRWEKVPTAEEFVKGIWCFAPCPQRHLAPSEEPLATPAPLPGTVKLEPFNRDKKTFLKTTK